MSELPWARWFKNNERDLELAYLNKLIHLVCTLRVEVSKLHTEVRDLRAERKSFYGNLTPQQQKQALAYRGEENIALHYPPPAPSPEKKWWGAPWKTSLG